MPKRAKPICLPLPWLWPQRVGEAAALYRRHRPERTTFYALLEQHLEDYIRAHSERFEPRHGALCRVVRRVGEAFLDCGRFQSTGQGRAGRIHVPTPLSDRPMRELQTK